MTQNTIFQELPKWLRLAKLAGFPRGSNAFPEVKHFCDLTAEQGVQVVALLGF